MLNDLTPAFILAMDSYDRAPIQFMVVHFGENIGDVYLADRDLILGGKLYDGLVVDWGKLQTVGAENAVSETMELSVTIWNGGEQPFTDYFSTVDPVNVFVDIYQSFEGLDITDAAHLGEYVMQDPIVMSEASSTVSIGMVTSNMRYFGKVGKLLTKDDYPNALPSDVNKPINLIVGNAGVVKCLCGSKPPIATMSGSILKIPTTVDTHEDLNENNFPHAGWIQIDDEIMRYSSKNTNSFVISARGEYGTLATDHSDGAAIILSRNQFGHLSRVQYIVGLGPLSSITDVEVMEQVTTGYSIDLGESVSLGGSEDRDATITFDTQPTFFEYSKGARAVNEDFDAPNSDDDSYHPDWAYDTNNRQLGAILQWPTYPKLSLIQLDGSVDQGEIISIFLSIDHWSTTAYAGDRMDVYVEGVNGNRPIGYLNRPNVEDIIEVGGEVDLTHGHTHKTTGGHGHGATQPTATKTEDAHPHSSTVAGQTFIDPGRETTGLGIPISVDVSGGSDNLYFTAPQHANTISKHIIISVLITGSDTKVTLYTGASNNIKTTWQGTGLGPVSQRIETSTGDVRVRVLCEGGSTSGVVIQQLDFESVTEGSITPNETLNLDITNTGAAVDTTGTTGIKAPDDVDSFFGNEDIAIDLANNAARAVTQKFDLTDFIESASWDWIKDRKVWVQYVNSSAVENPIIVITYLNFEIEYRQRQVRTTDEITCYARGSIESRPDAVIQYLLNKKAGLPESKFGSVYRNVPVWNDSDNGTPNVWWDTQGGASGGGENNAWIDGGEVADVPPGALFEEAGSWFSFNNYTIDGVLDGSLTIKDAIQKITWQTRSRLLWQSGKAKLTIRRKLQDWIIADDILPDDIEEGSYSSQRTPVTEISNLIELSYDIDRLSEASGAGRYLETSVERDSQSITKHGERSGTYNWLFDLVRNTAMAENISDFYLWRLGLPTVLYFFRAYLNKYNLEKDDYVTISSYSFDKLFRVPSLLVESERSFGSSATNKINTLAMIAQVIRQRRYSDNFESSVSLPDEIEIDFKDQLILNDIVLLSDIVDIVVSRNFEDDIDVGSLIELLAEYSPAYNSNVYPILSRAVFDITMEINSAVAVRSTPEVSDKKCFGACGFGTLPFGTKALYIGEPEDYIDNIGSMATFIMGSELSDDIEIPDNIVGSDGFGSPSIGDGFGVIPFGD